MERHEKDEGDVTYFSVIMGLMGCAQSIDEQIHEQLELGQKYLTEMIL